MKHPKRYLDISAAYIKTEDVKIKRDEAKAQLVKAGRPVVTESGVYGSSNAPNDLRKAE